MSSKQWRLHHQLGMTLQIFLVCHSGNYFTVNNTRRMSFRSSSIKVCQTTAQLKYHNSINNRLISLTHTSVSCFTTYYQRPCLFTYITIQRKIKMEQTLKGKLCHIMPLNNVGGKGGIAPLSVNLGARCKWWTSRPGRFAPSKESSYPLKRGFEAP